MKKGGSLLLGIAFILGGIACLASPWGILYSLSWVAGLIVVAAGVISMAMCFMGLPVPGMLTGSVLLMLFGTCVLMSGFAASLFPYAAGILLAAVGVNRILRRHRSGNAPKREVTVGVIAIALGVVCVLWPQAAAFAVGAAIGIPMILIGIGRILRATGRSGDAWDRMENWI